MPGIFQHQASRKVNSVLECLPQFVPATSTVAIAQDFHITEVVFTNVTDTDATVTIKDRQSTPVAAFDATIVPARSAYGVVYEGRWMPDGFTWFASAANAITSTVRGY